MEKLKPCPFCGHKPMMEKWSSGGMMYMLKCSNYNCIKGMDTYPRGHDLPKVIEEWNTRTEKEPAPLTGGYGHELNKLQRRIEDRKEVLNILKELRGRKVVITDYNNGSIRIPDELHNVFLTLLEDYYTRKLNELKEEFKEG